MAAKPRTIDDVLAAWPVERRRVLQRMREIIRSAAPGAEECISYQLPAFRLHGRGLVAFGGAAKHIALYPMGSGVLEAFREELQRYDCSKGTLRFPWDRPLPAMLIRRIVKARAAANRLRAAVPAKRAGRERVAASPSARPSASPSPPSRPPSVPARSARRTIERLEDLPNVGPATAEDLRRLGIQRPAQLAGRDPYAMYETLCRRTGQRHDPCVIDVFVSIVRFVDGGPARPWWAYTAERKARTSGPARGRRPRA